MRNELKEYYSRDNGYGKVERLKYQVNLTKLKKKLARKIVFPKNMSKYLDKKDFEDFEDF